jgi:hypothetical protein
LTTPEGNLGLQPRWRFPPRLILRFLILIPHRDCNKALRAYRRSLFASGLSGAWSFPIAVPLAQISNPFTIEELKEAAHKLRELSVHGGRDGKFHSAGTVITQSPEIEGFSFFGTKLDFSKPLEEGENIPINNKKVIYNFNTLCLCTALISSEGEMPPSPIETGKAPPLPQISFRAASIANLAMRPLSTGEAPYSREWSISAPVWLPAYKPGKKRNKASE